ncbi:unnamed protein product [Rotaria sordida]|uniref:Uncharacterized protein n=1 Tax=Rotaria sordida TaxID=392033 RepID=A0A815G164_9BILA|nr:unnamed protein product [Rotaria sordida]
MKFIANCVRVLVKGNSNLITLVSTVAMPFSSLHQIDDDKINSFMDDVQIQRFLRRPVELNSWPYKRNSPLCDYRLQFRPLALTPALCAYRNNYKEDPNQINPFKYG